MGKPRKTPRPKKKSVMNAFGRAEGNIVSTPVAQHSERDIPKPKRKAPMINPRFIGLIQRL